MKDEQPVGGPGVDLYGLPLEEFVAARDALARELKTKGDAAGARAVKSLVKPGVAAWLTNQTVRRAPALVSELLRVTDELAAAQRALARSRDTHDRFQKAAAEQRRVIDELMAVARTASNAARHAADDAILERVENNLKWSPISPESRAAFEAGRLLRDVAPPGFAALAGQTAELPSVGDAPPVPPPTAVRPHRAAASSSSSEGQVAPAREKDATPAAVTMARAAAVEARQQERATERAEAQSARDHVRRLHELEGDLRRARAGAETARRAHEDEQAALRKAEARVRALENDLELARARLAQAKPREQAAASEWSARRQEASRLDEELSAARKKT